MSAYLLVSLHTSFASTATATSTQPAAQPQAIALKLVQHRLESSQLETGAEQTSGDSAFSHIKFTSTLVKSISNSATISRVRV